MDVLVFRSTSNVNNPMMRSPSKDGYLMVPGSRQRGSSLPEPREREEEGAGKINWPVWPDWAKFCCLSTFYLSIFLHSQLNKRLKTWFDGLILTLKAVGCRCFGLSIWDLRFWLQFWLHFQILCEFLFNFLVTLLKNINNFDRRCYFNAESGGGRGGDVGDGFKVEGLPRKQRSVAAGHQEVPSAPVFRFGFKSLKNVTRVRLIRRILKKSI